MGNIRRTQMASVADVDELKAAVESGTVVVLCKASFAPRSMALFGTPEDFSSIGKVVVVDMEEVDDCDDVLGAVEPPSAVLFKDGEKADEIVGGACASKDAIM